MIPRLFTANTPNGRKPLLMLEALGVPYQVVAVNLGAGEQKSAAFLEKNPNGRIPVWEDDAATVWESGAILVHLAERHGRFLPTEPAARAAAMAWLFFQMSAVGPMFGQAWHFARHAPEDQTYAKARYLEEVRRILGVLEVELARHRTLGGDALSIADFATWPWVSAAPALGLDLAAWPSVARWVADVGAEPAVQRAMAVPL
jgi:GST-like protein